MNKKLSLRLVGAVYGLLFSVVIIISLLQFITDSLRFATGSIKPQSYTAQNLILKDFNLNPDGTIVSTSPDPQLIIENYNANSTMLRINFSFSRYPGEVNLYYTYADEEFSDSQKVWGKMKNNGSYDFIMPRGKLSRIRLDPTGFENNIIKINEFILNPERSFASYFSYSGEGIFKFIIYGAFICCFAAFIAQDFNAQLNKLANKLKKVLKLKKKAK